MSAPLGLEGDVDVVDAKMVKKNISDKRYAAFWRLLSFCKPEALKISLAMIALTANSVTNLSFPWIMGKALDRLGTDSLSYRKFIFGTTGFFVVGSVASWVRIYFLGTASDSISERLRQCLFDSYMAKDLQFFDDAKNGELITLIDEDVSESAQVLTDKLASGLRSLNSSVNGSILLYVTSPRLCGLALSVVPLVGVGAMLLSKYSSAIAKKVREVQSQTLSYTLERLSNITTVRLNDRQHFEQEKFRALSETSVALSRSRHSSRGLFMSFMNMSTNVSLLMVLREGGRMLSDGTMTTGALTRFALQSAFVGLGFSGLASFYADLVKSLDAAARVFDTIDTNHATKDTDRQIAGNALSNVSLNTRTTIATIATSTGSTDMLLPKDLLTNTSNGANVLEKEIVLSNVGFRYAVRPEEAVLMDINIHIKPRSITCIVGKSGSGKSTLGAILCGLYAPTTGCICVGDTKVVGSSAEHNHCKGSATNIHTSSGDSCAVEGDVDTGMRWLRANTGVVQQSDHSLMAGTITENIEYGKLGATQTEIEAAARAAAAHSFITQFPHGYDTQVGVGGSLLSGGQRARIALARALVRDPAVLLLDEVTSALDSANECEVISVLRRLRNTKSIVVITHSEEVRRAADVVLELEAGRQVSPSSETCS